MPCHYPQLFDPYITHSTELPDAFKIRQIWFSQFDLSDDGGVSETQNGFPLRTHRCRPEFDMTCNKLVHNMLNWL